MSTLIIGSSGIARAIATGLAATDGDVVALTDTAVLDEPGKAHDALVSLVGDSAIDLVVYAHLDPAGFSIRPIIGLSEQEWDDTAERSLRHAFVALQQIHTLVTDGTPIVVVLPNVGAVGVAGLVPLCSAVEGIRVMAKAVARRWGARSITVNTIGVELSAFMLGGAEAGVTAVPQVPVLGSPALPDGSVVDDVLALLEVFASPAGRSITGAFLMADRGTVMLP
jgi:NAD(P)-dependent dehydrogenase (short-subunit alcohol dehydrogenase family)